MKKFLLITLALVISFTALSQTNCPTNFTRNNGNNGSCASHIRLYFPSCPSFTPTLDSIKIDGVLQPETFTIFAKVCSGSSTYIDYCVSDNNLIPIGLITVYMTYPAGSVGPTPIHKTCGLPSPGILPVILSGFDVQRNNNDVSATWQTQQENNSSRFEIERAYENTSFQKIGSVEAAGTSNSLKTYTFSDNSNISKGVSFYRIKMIGKDGAFTYTETKSVKGSGANFDFAIFPNPAIGNTNVTINGLNEQTEVQLLDVSGRLVKSVTLNNANTTQLNNLEKGSYFVRITGKVTGKTSVKKLFVIN